MDEPDKLAQAREVARAALDTDEIIAALEGDSNDAEHDALVAVADALGLKWKDPYDIDID